MNSKKFQVGWCLTLALAVCFSFFSSRISFAAHPLPKIIVTDMLDDDIRALLHILANPQTRNSVLAIVVSTGNVQLKSAVARKMVTGLGLNIPVFTGTATDLAANDVTRFAANYEMEGSPILSNEEIQQLRTQSGVSGQASQQLHQLFKSLHSRSQKADAVLLTAPIDLTNAIKKDETLAKAVLEDLFAMGLYKKDGSGRLIAPYNTMADPNSVLTLLRMFHRGLFSRFIHVPSDTVQMRSGLPGGYFPEGGEGELLRSDIRTAMQRDDFLASVLQAAQQYGYNWRHSAVQQFGIGVGTQIDRWVPGSFADPETAAGFYIADSAPIIFALQNERALSASSLKETRITPPPFGTNLNMPFAFVPGNDSTRPILDVQNFNGPAILQEHGRILIDFQSSNTVPQTTAARSSRSNTNQNQFERTGKSTKALMINFKNSPDDWFALLRIVSTQVGRHALRAGGIVTEGFNPKGVRESIIKFLGALGIKDIAVAAGYEYRTNEVSNIPNFRGELAFHQNEQTTRAFESLPSVTDGINARHEFTPLQILERSHQWASRNSATIDALILGEGIDLIESVQQENPELAENIGNLYVMGGGRYEPNSSRLVLSRNWLRQTQQVIQGIEAFGLAGKKVYVFSSNEFGGSIVANASENLGNGQAALQSLQQAAQSNSAMAALQQHWNNWARIFQWALQPNQTQAFNPQATVTNVSTSPLGLSMAEEWLRGELETGQSSLRQEGVSLVGLIEGRTLERNERTGINWLRVQNPLEVVPMATRFGIAIERIVQSESAVRHDRVVRQDSILNPEATQLMNRMNGSSMGTAIRCSEALR